MGSEQGNAQVSRLLRRLPSIDALKRRHGPSLRGEGDAALAGASSDPGARAPIPDELATVLCREAVAEAREAARAGVLSSPAAVAADIDARMSAKIDALRGPILRRVLNGTGVLIHTNAGRSPLAASALQAVTETSRGYCNLELSLQTGARGSRQDLLRPLLRWLCGAEDALVVNNGAAALMLALHALAAGRPVIVSRGELVEIGGSFRVPDVMRAAGARLIEVGTTNRTHLRDYQQALDACEQAGEPAAALLQIHRSNFEITGFVATPALGDLADLARARGVPLLVDLGSGAPADLSAYGLQPEPTVAEVLAAGADLVTFSGDKLIGGPQAGLVAGRSAQVQRLSRNAMARAVRVDSMVIAALEPTLRAHLLGRANAALPLYAAAALDPPALQAIGARLLQALGAALDDTWTLELQPAEARMGGGALPGATLPSVCLALQRRGMEAAALQAALRTCHPPILGRARAALVLLDLRSLLAGSGCEASTLQAELTAALVALC